MGITLPPLTTGILGIGIYNAALCAEVYRAGIQAVPAGQWEAAKALNLGAYRTWRDIIIPQSLPPIVPALGNYLIGIFKETPLLSFLAVGELMHASKLIRLRVLSFYRGGDPCRAVLPRHEPGRGGPGADGRDSRQPEHPALTEPRIKFENVCKRYGPLTVLDGLNMEVAAGELVTIIGPSGSGKTTVLRVLMTLEDDRGRTHHHRRRAFQQDALARREGCFPRARPTCAGSGPGSGWSSRTSTCSRT